MNIEVDSKTKIEYSTDLEPVIEITSDNGILEIFGTEEDLKEFATKLYNQVHKQKE